jgi:electron transfer flavoprotein alpha/beta subunit
MKVLVPVKRVVDYNVKVRVKSDGNGVELANVKMSMNPFDEIAVEEALRLKEAGKATEVVVVSIGPAQASETIRTGLAMGADRGILVKAEGNVEPLAVAKLLKARAEVKSQVSSFSASRRSTTIEPDRPDAGGPARMVAGHLRIQARSRRLDFKVTREVDGGLQTVKLKGPAIVTTDLRSERAALRLAAEHHEGEEEADRRQERSRLRRRPHAASRSAQDRRTARPQGRRQGQGRQRAGIQTQDRSRVL